MGNNLYQEFPMFPKQMSAPVQFSTGIDTKLLTPPNSPLLRVQGALGGHEISRHIVRNHCLVTPVHLPKPTLSTPNK